MAPTIRDRRARATRARIAEAALDLFESKGFAATTIDQIAIAAEVGRRTIFRHFATKEAILFDHFVVRRDAVVKLLHERPPDEPVLMSLHAVLRDVCEQGYDRRTMVKIWDVIATNPGLAEAELLSGIRSFENKLAATIQSRVGMRSSPLEIYALTLMALSWFTTAVRIYVTKGTRPLVTCYDEIVAVCLGSAARDLAPSLGTSAFPDGYGMKRRTRTRRDRRSARSGPTPKRQG